MTLLIALLLVAAYAEASGSRKKAARGAVKHVMGLQDPDALNAYAVAWDKQYPKLAGVVRAKANTLLKSPIPGVTSARWLTYAKRMREGKLTDLTDTWQVGAWRLRAPQLAALGLVRNVRRGVFISRMVWLADWVDPIDPEAFFKAPKRQYAAFAAASAQDAAFVRKTFARYLGTSTPWGPVTLSGILGLSLRAGRKGAAGWLAKPHDRIKFPGTTAAFRRANGVF
jgi:hypothetical protein